MGRAASGTDGRRALVQVLKKHTQAEVAEKLGVTQQTVSRWQVGMGRPNLIQRCTLEQHFGIRQAAWMTPQELRATGAQ